MSDRNGIVLAPHLDDEIIGCYSVLDSVDQVIYFHDDYRSVPGALPNLPYIVYEKYHPQTLNSIFHSNPEKVVYLPSKYDYHPLHRKVRAIGMSWPGKKMFYSVEMNTPWLEEEANPSGKRKLFQRLYPGELETISKSDKYFFFKSIAPYDDLIWASVKWEDEILHRWPNAPDQVHFLRNLHRHKFYFSVDIQQFGDDRDIEYLMFRQELGFHFMGRAWPESVSCEQMAIAIKLWVEARYPGRMVRVSVFEDGENGCKLE